MLRHYLLFLLLASVLVLGASQAQDDEDMGTVLHDVLMIGDTCTNSPCLFGQSLHSISFNQVHRVISDSGIRDKLIFVDSPRYTIRWLWSSEIASTLGVQVYSETLTEDEYNYIHEFGGFNSISFQNGIAYSIWLRFETRLSTLVQTYGEPILVDPLSYTQFGDMTFRIFFPNVDGYFTAFTRCENAELIASTRINGYTSTIEELHISEKALQWQGYTDNLPDCTIFQP